MFQEFQFFMPLISALGRGGVEAGGSLRVPGQPELHNETLTQDGKRKERERRYFPRTIRKETRGKR